MSTSRRSHWTNFIPVRGKPSGVGSHHKFHRLTSDFQHSFTIDDTDSDESLSRPSTARESSYDSAVSSTSSFTTTTSSTSNASKRSWPFELNEEDDQHELSNSVRSSKRHRNLINKEQEPGKLFACPYAKWEPNRYSAANVLERNYRSCSKCYLKDISRLKQHLYRVHARPIHYCPICYKDFKQEDHFVTHVALRSCLAQPCPFSEKMTGEQAAAVKKKTRGTTPYANWYQIYETLFPRTRLPSSPYATFCDTKPSSSSDFMQYIQRHLPYRLRDRLDNEVMISTSTQEIVMHVIENSIAQVLEDLTHDYDPSLDYADPTSPSSSPSQTLYASIEQQCPDANVQISNSVPSDFGHINRPTQITLPTRIHNDFAHTSQPMTARISYHITKSINLDHEDNDNDITNQSMTDAEDITPKPQSNPLSRTIIEQFPDLVSSPMTVVWHPPSDAQPYRQPDPDPNIITTTTTAEASDYFVDFHPITPTPISSIHFEDSGQWIPTMVLSSTSSVPEQSSDEDEDDEEENENTNEDDDEERRPRRGCIEASP